MGSATIVVRMEDGLLERVGVEARREGLSRNAWIVGMLERAAAPPAALPAASGDVEDMVMGVVTLPDPGAEVAVDPKGDGDGGYEVQFGPQRRGPVVAQPKRARRFQ